MHELAICQALVAELETLAEHHCGRVKRVSLTIGPLAGIEPSLLAHAYPLATAGTRAEGSRLVIEKSDLRILCRACGCESNAQSNCLLCRACSSSATDLLSGDELILRQVEIEPFEIEPIESMSTPEAQFAGDVHV